MDCDLPCREYDDLLAEVLDLRNKVTELEHEAALLRDSELNARAMALTPARAVNLHAWCDQDGHEMQYQTWMNKNKRGTLDPPLPTPVSQNSRWTLYSVDDLRAWYVEYCRRLWQDYEERTARMEAEEGWRLPKCHRPKLPRVPRPSDL